MDENIKPAWLKISEQKLAELLSKAGYPHALASTIISRARQIKAERKAAKTKATVAYQLWDDVLAPARTEVATLRVTKAQIKREPVISPALQAKYDALCAYESVLVKVIEKLRKIQRGNEFTPMQFAAWVREELLSRGKKPLQGAGDHWTHYVKPSDRRRVETLFMDYPYPARGKKKRPFEAKISKNVHERQRRRLVGQIGIELAQAEQEYELTTDPDERKHLDDHMQELHRANYKLDTIPRTSPLPATWEKLAAMR